MHKKSIEVVKNQRDYENKYLKIVVTYGDGSKKDFTPDEWALFEEGISNIARKIKYIPLNPKPSFFQRLFGKK